MQERPQTKRPAGGFTILELLVVMGVMILLLGALVPAIWNVENEGRLSAGVNTVTASVQAARAYAIERKVDLVSIPGAAHSGSAVIFVPGGEIRHTVNDQNAKTPSTIGAASDKTLQELRYNGYRDIPGREYPILPAGIDVVGIVGPDQLVFPPFAIHFDRQSRLVPGLDPRGASDPGYDGSTWIVYDGDVDGRYDITATRTGVGSYADYTKWDHSREDFDDIKASGAGFVGTLGGGKYALPFEAIEPVIGIIVYSKFQFEDSGASDLFNASGTGWLQEEDPNTKKLTHGSLIYFGRYSGTSIKE